MMDDDAPFYSKGTVKFKNGASEAVPPHAVMEITASERDSTTGEIIYTVGKPSTTFRRFYLVNGPMEVADSSSVSKYGKGTFLHSGGAVLYESGNTPAIGESWGAKASQWSLAKNRPGFLITAANNTSATAPYTSAVQSVIDQLLGKPDANISKGSSGTVSVYMGAANSETDASIDITACALGAAVTMSKWVTLAYINSTWYVFPWEC
jgi:hypothetical protein